MGFVTSPLAETKAIKGRLILAPGGKGIVGQEAASHTEEAEREVECWLWPFSLFLFSPGPKTMVPLTLRQVKSQLSLSRNTFRHARRRVSQVI